MIKTLKEKNTYQIKITRAKIEDAQSIRELENKVWDEEVVNKYDIPVFVRFGYVFVAKRNNKIIGAIVSFVTNKNEIYVCDLVVDEKYRGIKIGERLYRKLLKSVKGKNVVSLLDPKLAPTIMLHTKLGAKTVAKVKNAYGLKKGLENGDRLLVRIHNF